MTVQEIKAYIDTNLPSNEKLTAEQFRNVLKVLFEDIVSQIGTSSSGVLYISNNGVNWRTIKGDGNVNTTLIENGDEVVVIEAGNGNRRTKYLITNNTNLTLPADFADDSKVDAYPSESPIII